MSTRNITQDPLCSETKAITEFTSIPSELLTSERLALAVEVAKKAGAYLVERLDAGIGDVDIKADGSPATEADRACEQLIRSEILKHFPEDGIFGEEHDEHPSKNGSRWIVDPIDGTAAFMRNVPLFGTMIAWQEHAGDREPVTLGVVYLPVLKELYFAKRGEGAWLLRMGQQPKQIYVSPLSDISNATVCTTSIDYFTRTQKTDAFMHMSSICGVNRGWSDCYSLLLLACGKVDAVYEPLLYQYDIAPLEVIIHEAGGKYTDWNGQYTLGSRDGLFTNSHLHDHLVEELRPFA